IRCERNSRRKEGALAADARHAVSISGHAHATWRRSSAACPVSERDNPRHPPAQAIRPPFSPIPATAGL
ncbi:hypothetical protein, partial [Klebsiella aerogenes]|uniref:hypothetical protein n=1 Tax=Klebsiella aerogenes TaxID=548 RepID=UPI0019536D31